MTATPTIRTILADDHDLVRSGLKLLLEMVEGLKVVYEARNGAELIESAQRLKPDLVVTDISMPDVDGLTALSQLRAMSPAPKVLVVSMHDSPDFIRRAVQLGAAGYVLKESSPLELEQAVGSVMRGHAYFSAQVSQKLLQAKERAPEELLTERQLEILLMIARGLATKEVAFKLGLSPKTVDVHRARIMERLGINDVAGLTLYCVRQGLIDPSRDVP
ncbi:response regulator transcription factor [Caldimonas brevitalea]|uniref:DNA-binding response regulator, LuxR family n=1 Tax=Caldimonas brevitalea TaxID=413882 RepID=A0A0G3BSI0_9BURK|nr:response regulator transcription factor [Caldimonas brevitalea]AKJ30336.1 DNA-binding response regulator, LuxR family [Caldimonas brevitalea]